MKITDDQTLVSAFHNGHPLKTYDDGFGPLFVYGNEFGPVAVIRAQTWHDAYGIAEDEFMDEATVGDVTEAIGEEWDDNDFNESFGYRPNGRRSPADSGMFVKSDYEWMRPLDDSMEIDVVIADPEPEPEPIRHFHSFHLTRRPMGRRGHYVGMWSGRYGTKGSSAFVCHKRFLATHDVY